jgi:phosphatidylserine decarboxylase
MQQSQRALNSKISALFGKFANTTFPKPIQSLINNVYVKGLGLDMSEFEAPSSYPTLNKLFTRKLKNARRFDITSNNFISPCDSFVTECGKIEDGISYQIKGMSYHIKELLQTSKDDLNKLINGDFINFYLSPKDYHRYHMPYDAKVLELHHIPGKLYPVNNRLLTSKLNLFIENERVIMKCKTDDDKLFFMVFVGALNVGKMKFTFDESIETNLSLEAKKYNYENLNIKKGDCIGQFEMGSTILVFFEESFVTISDIKNKKVKFTDSIANLN